MKSRDSPSATESIDSIISERFQYVGHAIAREKEIKGWDRRKRMALIESVNPTWEDLSLEWGKPIEMLDPATADEQQIPRFARDDNSDGAEDFAEIHDLVNTKK